MVEVKLPDPYPLYWPDGWKRTDGWKRQKSKYAALTFVQTRDELAAEVRRLGARRHVVTTCMQLRLDGLPLAGQREPQDPGVAVWWVDSRTGAQRVLACDKWATARENMRAVTKAIEALRAIERCGASQILDRAQESFTVPALTSDTGRPWWFNFLRLTAWPPRSEQVQEAYRSLARTEHPDGGGTQQRFVNLTQARDEALAFAVGGARG